jgi:hypothetical protein
MNMEKKNSYRKRRGEKLYMCACVWGMGGFDCAVPYRVGCGSSWAIPNRRVGCDEPNPVCRTLSGETEDEGGELAEGVVALRHKTQESNSDVSPLDGKDPFGQGSGRVSSLALELYLGW